MTTPTALTPPQFTAAYRLARAYGHAWATTPENEKILRDLGSGGALTPEMIRALHRHVRGEPYAAPDYEICAPVLEGDTAVHTTDSGQVRWSIEPDGATLIEVASAVAVYAAPDGALWYGPPGPSYGQRQIAALGEALLALGTVSLDDVAAELACLLAHCPERPDPDEPRWAVEEGPDAGRRYPDLAQHEPYGERRTDDGRRRAVAPESCLPTDPTTGARMTEGREAVQAIWAWARMDAQHRGALERLGVEPLNVDEPDGWGRRRVLGIRRDAEVLGVIAPYVVRGTIGHSFRVVRWAP